MAFELQFTTSVAKQLRRLDRGIATRIVDYLEAVASLDDPTVRGKNLTGEHSGIWRFRVGDYRIMCDIDKRKLTILALEVSHRSKSYRQR